jgi:hypothetical protein
MLMTTTSMPESLSRALGPRFIVCPAAVPRIFVRRSAIEFGNKRCADTKAVRLRREGRVREDAKRHIAEPRAMERLKQIGCASRCAAARIVGDVGKGQCRKARILRHVLHAPHCFVKRSQFRYVPPAIGPYLAGKRRGGIICRFLVVARRNEHTDSVSRRVRIAEIAADRHVQDVRTDHLLPHGHGFGIRPMRRQQRCLGREDRNAYEGFGCAYPAQHFDQRVGGLGTPLILIDMRVRTIGAEKVRSIDHPRRDERVQIERRDNRRVRPNAAANGFVQRCIGFGIFGTDGRAMTGDVNGIDSAGGCKCAPGLIEKLVQETLLDRTGAAATGHEHIDGLPRLLLAHAIDEAADFERAFRIWPGKILSDLSPYQVDAFFELGPTDTWRPGIGLKIEAHDRDATR